MRADGDVKSLLQELRADGDAKSPL